MLMLFLGAGTTASLAQDEHVADFFNTVIFEDGTEVETNEITVDPGETFTLILGIRVHNGPLDAVTASLLFDDEYLQVVGGEDGLTDLSGSVLQFPLWFSVINDSGYVQLSKATFAPPTVEPGETFEFDFLSVEFAANEDAAGTTSVYHFTNHNNRTGVASAGVEITGDIPSLVVHITGDFDCPELEANIGDACDDMDPNTTNDVVTEDCECIGTPAAPDNDNPCTAEMLECGATVTGSTENATASYAGEPTCAGGDQLDVFYTFTAMPGMEYTVTAGGLGSDGVLALYGGDCEILEELNCADDNTSDAEELSIMVDEETTILVQFYDYSGTSEFEISLDCEEVEPAPSNDNPCDAVVLGCYQPIEGNTTSATESDIATECATFGDNLDLFYSFTAVPGQQYTVIVSGEDDMVLALYNGSCDAGYENLECSDVTGDSETISITVDEEQEILVRTSYYNDGGSFTLTLSCEDVTEIENDDCEGAIALECNTTVTGSTTLAGIDDPGCNTSGSNGPGVWYTYTTDVETIVTLETCQDGTDFDTDLNVFTGSCDNLVCFDGFSGDGYTDGTDLDDVTCTGTFPLSYRAGGEFTAQPGVTYYIYLSGYDSDEAGNYAMTISCQEFNCTSPELSLTPVMADETPVGDCLPAGESFYVQAAITGGSGNGSYVLWVNGDSVDIVDIESTTLIGPYMAGEDVDVSIVGVNSDLCGDEETTTVAVCPPDNDTCEEAMALECGTTVTGSTDNAMFIDMEYCGTSAPSAGGVWYTFTAGEENLINLDLSGSDYDTKMFLYSGACGELVCVEGDDDDGDGTTSMIDFEATPGEVYYVFVTGYSSNTGTYSLSMTCEAAGCVAPELTITSTTVDGAPTGDCLDAGQMFMVNVELTGGSGNASYNVSANGTGTLDEVLPGTTVSFGPYAAGTSVNIVANGNDNDNCSATGSVMVDVCAPDNDECIDAIMLACNQSVDATTTGSTESMDPVECGGFSATSPVEDVWFSFMADGTSSYSIETSLGFDAVLSLYSGECDDLELISCADNTITSAPEVLETDILPAGEYFVRVYKYSGTGNFTITLGCEVSYDCPDLEANIGDDCGINGTINEDCECVEEPVSEYCSPTEVISYNPGLTKTGEALDPNRSNPNNALGAPQDANSTNYFTTLGFGGELILGWDMMVMNGDGNDFRIAETTRNDDTCEEYEETADLYVSQNAVDWAFIGTVCHDGAFDISDADPSWTYIRYVKIVDVTSETSVSTDGYDVDGLIALHECMAIDECYATEMISYNPGNQSNGSPVAADRSNPDNALGAPQNNNTINFVALGFGGDLVLGFNPGAINGAGADLHIVETTYNNGCDNYPENADVYLSQDGSTWAYAGNICQSAYIDISDADPTWTFITQIKIVDTTPESSPSYDGYDVDGVVVLNGCGSFPLPGGEDGQCTATEVVEYIQGTRSNGNALPLIRTNADNALGEAQDDDTYNFVSLGYNGSLTLAFGGTVPNGPGDDIQVVETSFGSPACGSYNESVEVSVSVDNITYYSLGTICLDGSVDISSAAVELDYVNYVRLTNHNDMTNTDDGYDVDAVYAIHNCEDAPTPGSFSSDSEGDALSLAGYPSPTSGQTTVTFTVPSATHAKVEVYNMEGKRVATLFNQNAAANQQYKLDFDGSNLPNGVYVYRLTTESNSVIEKFVLAK